MTPTIIESPYAGDIAANTAYALECMCDSLARGEAPFASHLLYTQVLDDADPKQREQGIRAGHAWARLARTHAFYLGFGVSPGMRASWERIVNVAKHWELTTTFEARSIRRPFRIPYSDKPTWSVNLDPRNPDALDNALASLAGL